MKKAIIIRLCQVTFVADLQQKTEEVGPLGDGGKIVFHHFAQPKCVYLFFNKNNKFLCQQLPFVMTL